MSTPNSSPRSPQPVTPNSLRSWPLPDVSSGASKYDRGQVVVLGGAAKSPGAAMLAGIAALRMGAGRLTLGVAESVAAHVAVAIPESGVVALASDSALEEAASDLFGADAVLLGPGLDDAEQAERMLRALPGLIAPDTVVILDAYCLGVLPRAREIVAQLSHRLVLTPNLGEAGYLLERDAPIEGDITAAAEDIRQIADRFSAVVSCQGLIVEPGGGMWQVGSGSIGLGTSGSGDVLGGAITGLCARGASPVQAAVWATHAHAAAGDRLAVQVGPLGFLAGELLDQLPRVLVEIGT